MASVSFERAGFVYLNRTNIYKQQFMSYHIAFSGNNAWGMYNFRGKLLRHFVERGFKVTVLAPYDDVYTKKLQELGCEVLDMPMDPKGVNPFVDALLLYRYYKVFKKLNPDISVTYTIKPNIYGGIAARLLKIPYLPITTGLGYVFINDDVVAKIVKKLYGLAFKKAEKVWFLNDEDIEDFRRENIVDDDKIQLLPGEGIDLSRFKLSKRLESTSFTFILVARMLVDKGVCEFVEAARVMKKKYPKLSFKLLGAVWKDNPAAISEAQLRKWEEEGVVEYLGVVSDVIPTLLESDCVVLPSAYREGVPFSLMEGAALGLPLIASDIAGCRDVVIDGYNGFLCKKKDVPSLVEAMEKIVDLTPEECKQFGAKGRKIIEERFELGYIIKQYDAAFTDILSKRRKA